MVEPPQAAAVASPLIGVLALQGDYEAHALALEEAGAQAVAVRLPTELFGLDGLVIPGGESSALLKLMACDGLFDALRAFAAKKPVFGTCAGCILLARRVVSPRQPSLGLLDVTVERNAYGRQIESAILKTPTTLEGGPIETVYIRAPRIVATGPAVEVLAMRDRSPVLVRQDRILASTFHPELSADRRVHRLFCTMAMDHAGT
ncbi:MAG: pyridoxal 5'-phosphate synthase glutaminase subunit PdxT [Rhodospirillaceae bacterium]|nr:MAG: pyridoxal 5'-phosphate synthase glutaminase subunit PdxT [Rhodospirillaceae bacterium]